MNAQGQRNSIILGIKFPYKIVQNRVQSSEAVQKQQSGSEPEPGRARARAPASRPTLAERFPDSRTFVGLLLQLLADLFTVSLSQTEVAFLML